jgi:hypothetical protein
VDKIEIFIYVSIVSSSYNTSCENYILFANLVCDTFGNEKKTRNVQVSFTKFPLLLSEHNADDQLDRTFRGNNDFVGFYQIRLIYLLIFFSTISTLQNCNPSRKNSICPTDILMTNESKKVEIYKTIYYARVVSLSLMHLCRNYTLPQGWQFIGMPDVKIHHRSKRTARK